MLFVVTNFRNMQPYSHTGSFVAQARGCAFRARQALLCVSAVAPSLPPSHPCKRNVQAHICVDFWFQIWVFWCLGVQPFEPSIPSRPPPAAHSHHCDSCGCRGEFRFVNSHPSIIVVYILTICVTHSGMDKGTRALSSNGGKDCKEEGGTWERGIDCV